MKTFTPNDYVFDTYAIMEILEGNEAYKKYLECTPLITKMILAELAYNLIRKKNISVARKNVEEYSENVVELDNEVILKAMNFRYKNRKKRLSMTDCTGYVLAKKLGMKFLTGDKQFKNMENVEFVK